MKFPGRTTGSKILEYFNKKKRLGKLCRSVHRRECKLEWLSPWCSCKITQVAHKEMFTHCLSHLEHYAAKKLIWKTANKHDENCQWNSKSSLEPQTEKNTVWTDGFATWTFSAYRSKMTVKRASSSAFCWAQERNKTVFRERNSPLSEFLSDEMWMIKLAYLASIICHLNKLNAGDLYKYLCTEKEDRGIQKEAGVWNSFVRKEIQGCFRH